MPESIFDIRVLDDQNNQIQQFEGSEQGTTIQNLEPGIYTVNEIKNPTSDDNQLGQNQEAELVYIRDGFSDAGKLDNTASVTNYSIICFEYEDEQGTDCSTIALATGESRTCTGKNNIRIAFDSPFFNMNETEKVIHQLTCITYLFLFFFFFYFYFYYNKFLVIKAKYNLGEPC